MTKRIDRLMAALEDAAAASNEAEEGTRIIAQRGRGMRPEDLQELQRVQHNTMSTLDHIRTARRLASDLQKGQTE